MLLCLPSACPIGTVLWSNPGDGSGVGSIVPAVPSASGVADVFAIQNDGTVQAIISDGTTAWTAQVGLNRPVVPGFQGGLAVYGNTSITKLDGITGQTVSTYTPNSGGLAGSNIVVHPDGTIFAVTADNNNPHRAIWVVGIDPTSGAQKFSVPLPEQTGPQVWDPDTLAGSAIIGGDGYFYVPYSYSLRNPAPADGIQGWYLMLLRVNSAGGSDNIQIAVVPQASNGASSESIGMKLISNADTGVLVTWRAQPILLLGPRRGATPKDSLNSPPTYGIAITTGTGVNVISTATLPNQAEILVPGVQAQDGSFVGSYSVNDPVRGPFNMIAFDASGNTRWNVPNEQPLIATEDGGVIGQSGTTYDQSGNATGQINVGTQSWLGYTYRVGSIEEWLANVIKVAKSWWPFGGGNASGNKTAFLHPPYAQLDSCNDQTLHPPPACPGPRMPFFTRCTP
jgi:hypothetical protein